MMDKEIYEALLDTVRNPIVFVDNEHIIRYLNKAAKTRYYKKRGYSNLIGKSLFDCHNKESEKLTKEIHTRLLDGEDEVFLKVSDDNEAITVVSVRDSDGSLIVPVFFRTVSLYINSAISWIDQAAP
jgi:PAS domain S-box-containing protein